MRWPPLAALSPVPLATMGLTALALRTGAIAAYVSLGVVEHDPAGPDAILAEAHRVLAPGGTLVISVPYVNGVRRLGAGWIRRQNRTLAAAGGKFYQYAFTRAELLAALGRHGFTPLAVHPYDPARILRKLRPWSPRGCRGRRPSARPASRRPRAVPGGGAAAPGRRAATAQSRPARRVVRRALYTEPALRLLGHMLLVVARRVTDCAQTTPLEIM